MCCRTAVALKQLMTVKVLEPTDLEGARVSLINDPVPGNVHVDHMEAKGLEGDSSGPSNDEPRGDRSGGATPAPVPVAPVPNFVAGHRSNPVTPARGRPVVSTQAVSGSSSDEDSDVPGNPAVGQRAGRAANPTPGRHHQWESEPDSDDDD